MPDHLAAVELELATLDDEADAQDAAAPTLPPSDGISVAATKKRGRPKAFSWLEGDAQAKVTAAILTSGKSRRMSLHWLYATEALAVIPAESGEMDPRFAWFEVPRVRISALAELGRFAVEFGHDAARRMADFLMNDLEKMDEPPTTRLVEQWMRSNRLKAQERSKAAPLPEQVST